MENGLPKVTMKKSQSNTLGEVFDENLVVFNALIDTLEKMRNKRSGPATPEEDEIFEAAKRLLRNTEKLLELIKVKG